MLNIKNNDEEYNASINTEAQHLLKKRGILVGKDFHEIGIICGISGGFVVVNTFIFTVYPLTDQVSKKFYGIHLEHNIQNYNYNNYIDFDEIDDCLQALNFLTEGSIKMAENMIDYKEIYYSTKDNNRFGILQYKRQQQFFMNLEVSSESLRFEVNKIKDFSKLIKNGKDYLINKGAG